MSLSLQKIFAAVIFLQLNMPLAIAGVAPRDKSLFSIYVKEWQEWPTNFDRFAEKLVDAGRNFDRSLYEYFQTAVVPRGRSLQRDHVRELRALSFKSGDTFIGYAPETKQGEVISWNPAKARYEFLQFSGFGTKEGPKIKTASRAFCMSCHQSGGAIFPRAPWSELVEERGFEKFGGLDPELKILPPIERERRRFKNHRFFDLVVRRANERLQVVSSCRKMCGSDLDCRQQLLAIALAYHNTEDRHVELEWVREEIQRGKVHDGVPDFSDFPEDNFVRLQASLEKNWPKNGFGIISSTLPDRSVAKGLGYKLNGKLKNGEDPNFSDGFSLLAPTRIPAGTLSSEDEELQAYLLTEYAQGAVTEAKLKKGEKAFLDPKSVRPIVNKIPKRSAARWALAVAFDCFSFRDSDLFQLRDHATAVLTAAASSPAVGRVLCDWPADKRRLLSVLSQVVGQGPVTNLAQERPVCGPSSKKVAAAKVTQQNTVDQGPSALFRRYCNDCHGPNTSDYSFRLDDLNWLKSYRGLYGTTVKRFLETRAMPPKTAAQPALHELQVMIDALE